MSDPPPPKWSPLDDFRNAQPSANPFPSRRLPPILPPPIATVTHAPSLPVYRIAYPPLPPMSAHPQAAATSPVLQTPIAQPQYYTSHGQAIPPSQHPSSPHYAAPSTVQYGAPTTPSQAKKEIKRRTKTGCLTCRARRIKCDEQKPTCRNCIKSKRECQGYDPHYRASPSIPAGQPTMQAASQSFNDFAPIDPTLDSSLGAKPLPGEYDPSYQGFLTVPPLNIQEILDVGSGHPPPSIPAPSGLEPADRQSVTSLFEILYAPFIDKFLETKWFTSCGFDYLLQNAYLLEKYKVLKPRFIYTPSIDMREYLVTQSLEAHVIWETMLLARQVSESGTVPNDPSSDEAAANVYEAAKRVSTFEALVTNEQLDSRDVLPEPVKSGTTSPAGRPALQDQLLSREQNFWHLTSKFCALRDDSKSLEENPVEEIDKILTEMRLLLDSRENRDILYSIAVTRHIGHKLTTKAAAQAQLSGESTIGQPVGNNEDDPATKVSVARRFIQDEASGKGTNQVTQRICGMAVMAWSKR